MKQLHINEDTVLEAIERVLKENRKVIKTGNSTPAAQPDMNTMPPTPPSTPQPTDMGNQNMMSDIGQNTGGQMAPDSSMGDDMGMENQFDSNFDAGVEADEDTDPKHYIQQLTGKLSQKLGSFNEEQGGDAGLNKYVASMIIKAACKYLDDNAKKDLIEKINTAENSDTEMPEDDSNMEEPEMGGEDTGMEQPSMDDAQTPPMNETVYTKKSLMLNERLFTAGELRARYRKELNENPGISANDIISNDSERPQETKKINCPKAWTSKFN